MKAYRIIVYFSLLFIFQSVSSQDKYWIFFEDKDGVNFNPYEYFDQKVIEKRERRGIPLVQFTDLPLRSDYCEKISEYADISLQSRWLNAVSAELEEEDIQKIFSLDFVKDISRMTMVSVPAQTGPEIDSGQIEHLENQLRVLGESHFAKQGIDGSGVRIAVFDGGFPAVDKLEIFDHLYKENRIIATWDFVNDQEFVYDYNSHGTSVLGCIAGVLDDRKFGLAPGAEFLLARTEVNTEIFAEEEYWAAAMEWADRNGADIISSSLGYTFHRYFPKQMDGKSIFVTRMANMAASKGILVVNSAGNAGDSDWEVIGAPADADSVLSVGGISSIEGLHISFSSFGPTYDGRMKPNVVAFGHVVTTGKNGIKKAYGTSFSAPLVSGFAACVMQIHPDWDNMKVFKEIEKSGHLYPYYDYAHGYGVPQASYFTGPRDDPRPTFEFREKVNYLAIELNLEQINKNKQAIAEGSDTYFGTDHNYLYYHIASKETGVIRRYSVVRMTEANSHSIELVKIKEGEFVMAHYMGYTESYTF